ncbi:MAG: ABC transporter ATP-binding protein, partial [Solirubrobacterales bacterium]|nr:ABC transporter ATP-binding protein [Solirubrobacterales bacterium]
MRVEAVSQRFGDRVVLDEVSAVLHEHRIGVIGANGSG